jgi:hypothetical protein
MIYSVSELRRPTGGESFVRLKDGSLVPARPVWSSIDRWRHAWWVFTGRCDAVWWPEDGNPYDYNNRRELRRGR